MLKLMGKKIQVLLSKSLLISVHMLVCYFSGRSGYHVNDGTVNETKENRNHRWVIIDCGEENCTTFIGP